MRRRVRTIVRTIKTMAAKTYYRIKGPPRVLRFSARTNREVLVLFGAKISPDFVRIHSPVTLHGFAGNYSNLEIADGCLLGGNNFLDLTGRITLEAGVSLGPGVTILTHDRFNHNEYLESRFSESCGVGDVRVGRGTGVKAHAVISKGVSIGHDAIIGGGAFVSRDVPARHFVAGVPAKTIRVLSEDGLVKPKEDAV